MSWADRQAAHDQAINSESRDSRQWAIHCRRVIATDWPIYWRAVCTAISSEVIAYNAKFPARRLPPLECERPNPETISLRLDQHRIVRRLYVEASPVGIRLQGTIDQFVPFVVDDEGRLTTGDTPRTPGETATAILDWLVGT